MRRAKRRSPIAAIGRPSGRRLIAPRWSSATAVARRPMSSSGSASPPTARGSSTTAAIRSVFALPDRRRARGARQALGAPPIGRSSASSARWAIGARPSTRCSRRGRTAAVTAPGMPTSRRGRGRRAAGVAAAGPGARALPTECGSWGFGRTCRRCWRRSMRSSIRRDTRRTAWRSTKRSAAAFRRSSAVGRRGGTVSLRLCRTC